MSSPTSKDYLAIANKYIDDVLKGVIPAKKEVRLACNRQKKDLVKYGKKNSVYYFNEDEANRICRFIELLPHTKGELAGQPIKLEPWQVFILTTVFGWKRRVDEGRRFRRVYIEVSRGNGKSCLSSGVALYCLVADREPGAEVYSFATTRDQAGIVFGDAKVMAQKCAALRKKFGLEVLAHSLYVKDTNSSFQAKSAEGSTLDGLNTHLAIIDELHAHKTRDVYDVVETSLGKRRSSLLWCITTAGFNTSGICYEVRTMARKVLEGKVNDPTQFAVIYGIDDEDPWDDEKSLIKANPNWGVSVRPEMITSLLQKAKALPSSINNFKTKHLCVWCAAASAWMDMAKWNACAVPELSLDDFIGAPCFIGLDLAAKNDITAKVLVFPMDGGNYAVFGKYYLPEVAIHNGTNAQYSGWATEGLITETQGAVTDFEQIEADLREDLSTFDVRAVAYDPWNATQLATRLANDGAPMVEFRNSVMKLSQPMKTLEALIQGKQITHNGDPILTWMMSNVVAKVDAKDNIFPRKEVNANKIDGVVATIMALGVALENPVVTMDFDGEDDPFSGFEW